ncbi:MAG: homoserine O-acetyltransferase [Wenzhouxiangellaceae bacterium]
MSSQTPLYRHPDRFPLRRGGALPRLQLAYETWGELNADASNAILLFTGLSPGAHAASSERDPDAGWWEAMIGPGKPIDTRRYYVICVNSLGSCKGSTGPASLEPGTGQPWRLRFPALSIEDIAAATRLVLQHLGVARLHTVIGPSMGGMTTLAWLKQFPGISNGMINISSASSASPYAIAIRSLQREAICSDPNWNNGHYDEECWPEQGMRIARKLGMISYRSAAEWRERFGRQRQDQFPRTLYGMDFAIESYLENHARRFIGQFDPICYIYLSHAMDWFDAADSHDSVAAMLQASQLQRALVIGVETDSLFPLWQQQALADDLVSAGVATEYAALDSIQGHDAFLIDYEQFGPLVENFLA